MILIYLSFLIYSSDAYVLSLLHSVVAKIALLSVIMSQGVGNNSVHVENTTISVQLSICT